MEWAKSRRTYPHGFFFGYILQDLITNTDRFCVWLMMGVFASHGCAEQIWQWQSMIMTVDMTPPAIHDPYLAFIHSGDSGKCHWTHGVFLSLSYRISKSYLSYNKDSISVYFVEMEAALVSKQDMVQNKKKLNHFVY